MGCLAICWMMLLNMKFPNLPASRVDPVELSRWWEFFSLADHYLKQLEEELRHWFATLNFEVEDVSLIPSLLPPPPPTSLWHACEIWNCFCGICTYLVTNQLTICCQSSVNKGLCGTCIMHHTDWRLLVCMCTHTESHLQNSSLYTYTYCLATEFGVWHHTHCDESDIWQLLILLQIGNALGMGTWVTGKKFVVSNSTSVRKELWNVSCDSTYSSYLLCLIYSVQKCCTLTIFVVSLNLIVLCCSLSRNCFVFKFSTMN